MSIRLRLTIIFLAFILVPSLFIGLLTFKNYRNSLESILLSKLQDIVAFKADKIETYFTGLKANIAVAQGYYNIKKNLPLMTRFAGRPEGPEFLAAKGMLDEQLRQMTPVLGLADIMLVDPQGKVVYSSSPGHTAKDFLKLLPDPEQKTFREGKKRIYFSDIFPLKVSDGRLEMLIAAPAHDLSGAFIGVIVFEVEMGPIFGLVQDVGGLGVTGETLLGKKTGNEVLFLNPLRHDQTAALRKKIPMGARTGMPMQQAVEGGAGVGMSIDYRGEPVVSAWRYMPSLDWGIVAKMDAQEAFAEAVRLRDLVIVLLLIVSILSGVIAFSIAQTISAPIKMLSQGAEIIGSGNLDYKIGSTYKDEIGQLSRTFDKMTGDLKVITASRDELNREIAERKRTEKLLSENEARLKRSQEIAHLGGWELDLVKNTLAWSDEVYRIFGLQPQEFGATYEAFLEAVHPDDRAAVNDAYSGSLREGRDSYEIEHRVVRKATKEIRYVHEKCQHFRDKTGAVLRSAGMVQDITERRKSAEEIKTLNEALRCHVLDLETANRELEAFSYSVSHDLRSPLRSIGGFSLALLEDYADKLDAGGKDFLGRIIAATKRMGQLIDDLLNLSRITRTEMLRVTVDLSGIAKRVSGRLRELEPERRAECIIAEGLTANGDERLLNIALENLLGNAWKFTGKQDRTVIEFGVFAEGVSRAFFVKDNGAGFDMTYAAKLFSPFQRLHRNEDFPGTGIGLATVKRVIERHGGRVWIEGEKNNGTTVYFTLG